MWTDSFCDSVARDVKLQVEFDPDVVSSYRLVGYENRDIADKDFRNDRVDAGRWSRSFCDGSLKSSIQELKGHLLPHVFAMSLLELIVPQQSVYPLSSARIQKEQAKDLMLAYTATFAEVLRKSPYVHDVKAGPPTLPSRRTICGVDEDHQKSNGDQYGNGIHW